MDTKKAGRYLANCAAKLAVGQQAQEFADRNSLNEGERRRLAFGLRIINTVSFVRLVNMMPRPEENKAVIEAIYNRYFDVLGEDDSPVRVCDYVVDLDEIELLRAMTNQDVSAETTATLHDIASILYHTRQVEYLELIARSVGGRDGLGPMGGVALKFYQHLTGLPYDCEDEFDMGSYISPVDLSVVLAALLLELGEDLKTARSAFT